VCTGPLAPAAISTCHIETAEVLPTVGEASVRIVAFGVSVTRASVERTVLIIAKLLI
jgi:hypothetical protein